MTAIPAGDDRALAALKIAHTSIWLVVEAAMVYLIGSGLTRRTDRRAAVAAGVVAAESVIFLGNGARCPLTTMATRLGADSGSVTDIYLPRWLAGNLPAIHVPLVLLAVYLHTRNLRRQKQTASDRLVR